MRVINIALLLLLLFAGCQSRTQTAAPQQVAKRFWNAVIGGDERMAKAQTIRQRIDAGLPIRVRPERAEIEGARVIDGRAFVPTRIFFTIPIDNIASHECNATFDTELLNVEGRWLVDDIVTMENYRKGVEEGAVACGARMLDKTIQEGIREFEKFQKQLGNQSRELGETLKKSMQIWQRQMIEALKKMQKELEKGEPAPEEPRSLPEKGERI